MLEVLQPILDELIAANEVLMMGHELTASMGNLGRTAAPGNEAQLYLCARNSETEPLRLLGNGIAVVCAGNGRHRYSMQRNRASL